MLFLSSPMTLFGLESRACGLQAQCHNIELMSCDYDATYYDSSNIITRKSILATDYVGVKSPKSIKPPDIANLSFFDGMLSMVQNNINEDIVKKTIIADK